MANSDYNSGKASAVKFFMVLSCIASVVGGIAAIAVENVTGGVIMLVSLVWTIPMTIYASRRLNAHQYIGAGFKICTLLFHNLIAGIILLCMKTEGEDNSQDTAQGDKSSANNSNGASSVSAPKTAPRPTTSTPPENRESRPAADNESKSAPTSASKTAVIIFSKTLYRNYLIDRGYSVVTPSGNPSTVDDYCHRVDFVCEVEDIEWADLPAHIDRLLKEYDVGGIKQRLGAKSNNSVINALKRANECIQRQRRNAQ